ncbi:head-tail connector protein [Afipia sp. TerB]
MLKQIGSATSKPVTLDDLKAHCRIDSDDEDGSLGTYLDAAAEFVADRTSLVLAPTSYQIDRADWCADLQILVSPVRDIASVKYLDVNASSVTVDPSFYRWVRTDRGAVVEFLPSFVRPVLADGRDDAVQIAFEAGFDDPDATGSGDDPALILPVRAKQAVLLIAAHWFANREAVSGESLTTIPLAAESLLGQLRIYR